MTVWNKHFDYLLGLAATDGTLRSTPTNDAIEWLSTDRGIIQRISDETGWKVQGGKSRPDRPSNLPVYMISTPYDGTARRFTDAGICKNKTYELGPLTGYTEFWDVLRGIIDGDGCITHDHPYVRLQIVSAAPLFLEWIRRELEDRGILTQIGKRSGHSHALQVRGEAVVWILEKCYGVRKGLRIQGKQKVCEGILAAYQAGTLRYKEKKQ